jgi:gliding motility-associated lipoprotein GldH
MPWQPLKNICILTGILFLSSCGLNYTYNETVTIKDSKWYKDEVAHFELMINDSISNQNFYLTLRNTTDYRFSNLFIFMTTHFPNGNITRDTIECLLADQSGHWLGKGWGNVKENQILLKSGLRFPLTGKYEFYIQQAMRTDTLEGIERVGLIIEKAN